MKNETKEYIVKAAKSVFYVVLLIFGSKKAKNFFENKG